MKLQYLLAKQLVLIGLLLASFTVGAAAKPDNVEVMTYGDYRIHTFYGVSNSYIIETQNNLFMVDAQMLQPHAIALKGYIESIGKPLKKIFLSHNHPDHWFGAVVFQGATQIITSANVAADLKKGGGRFLKIMKKKLKDKMPNNVIVPDAVIELGEHDLDGLRVIIEEYKEHEAHHALIFKFPTIGVLVAQDMVYNNMFLVASERSRNQHWKEILMTFRDTLSDDYPVVMPGHGKVGGVDLYQQNIDYLSTLEAVLQEGLDKQATTDKMIALYPDRGGKGMLGISMRNLFSAGH